MGRRYHRQVRFLAGGRRQTLLAPLCVALAYATLVQGAGSNQTAHYALVKAFAGGTATADRTRYEVGEAGTMDVSWYRGHYYIAKAPGFAAAALPPYLLARLAGIRTTGDPSDMLWLLGLFTVVLPALVLLSLVALIAEDVAPGWGAATSTALGLGTLMLPFGTMFFAHVLPATLGFAAFAIVWRERRSRPSWFALFVAGGLAGLATTVEYPLAVIGVVVGGVAAATRPHLARAGAYLGAFAVGAAPLFLYNRWAFESWTHFPYRGVVEFAGRTGHDRLQHFGAYGVAAPSVRQLSNLLFAKWGLMITSPILAAAAAGVVLLFRRGFRVEALAIAAVSTFVPLYTSGVIRPYGDVAPGPRYLIPALPFMAVALAAAFRSLPITTTMLAVGSAVLWVMVTATRPMQAWDGHVLDRIVSGDLAGYSPTVLDVVGFTGPYRVVPFFIALLAAVVFVARLTPWSVSRVEVPVALAALVGWLISVRFAPRFEQFGSFGVALRGAAVPIAAAIMTACVAMLAGVVCVRRS
jgi:hypothetical protein